MLHDRPGMMVRNRPIVQFLGLTRSEELVANLLPQYEGGPLARAAHQRLAGFTLDETRSYIWSCLRGAGCDWAEELVPDHPTLGDVDSPEALADYQAGKRAQKAAARAAKAAAQA